jgi:hypothetical protein
MIRSFVRNAVLAHIMGTDGRIVPSARPYGVNDTPALIGAAWMLDGVRFPVAGSGDAPVAGGTAGQSHTRRSCLNG